MTLSRRRRRAVLAVGALLAALPLYVVWLALDVRASLAAVESSARELQAAAGDGDQPRAERALEDMQKASVDARRRTEGLLWSGLGRLPVVGDDTRAVSVAARAADLVAHEAAEPLLATDALDADGFAPRDGRIDLDRIAALEAPMATAAEVLTEARNEIASVDAEGLVGPLAARWAELVELVDAAATGTEAGTTAARLLPAMMGAEGQRHSLLVFETNAEPRATGGMPGSLARLDTRDGRLKLGPQRAASSLPVPARPILPLSTAEVARFGDGLGRWPMDAAFTPHFPRTAELLAAHWRKAYPGRLDSVIAIDPVALSYLLRATGPVTVDGVELTADTVAEELLNGAYLRIKEPAAQDAWFETVARTVFQRITRGPVNAAELARGLARATDEGRILLHSFHAGEQAMLAGTRIAGEVPDDVAEQPQAGVYLNDSTGSKMGWYLDYDVEITSRSCDADGQHLRGRMTLTSTAEPGRTLPVAVTGSGVHGTEKGDHLVSVELFGPQGGTLTHLRFDGRDQPDAEMSDYRSHPTTSVAVFLEPGATYDITWDMSTPSEDPVFTRVSAGVEPNTESSLGPGC